MKCSLFGCCVTSADEDEDDIRTIGLGRMKYSDKSQAKPQLSLTNGDGDDLREDGDSFYETPSYVVEASVVTVSGLQPVQVFEGTIFHESERRGLKKYASPSEVAARRKRRQNQAVEESSTKNSVFNELHHSAKQLLRCGQMLYGSGQEESAAIMFERSLQLHPDSILTLWNYGVALEARGEQTASARMISQARELAARALREGDAGGDTTAVDEEAALEALLPGLQQEASLTQMPVGHVSLVEMGDAIWAAALQALSARPRHPHPTSPNPTPPLRLDSSAAASGGGWAGDKDGGRPGGDESPPDSTRPTVRALKGPPSGAPAALPDAGEREGDGGQTPPAEEEAVARRRRAATDPGGAGPLDPDFFPVIREQECTGVRVVKVPQPGDTSSRNIGQGYIAEIAADRLVRARAQHP